MKTYRVITSSISLFSLVSLSCRSLHHKFNPEAIKLNDSAVNLVVGRPTLPKNDSATQVVMDKVEKQAKSPVVMDKVDKSAKSPARKDTGVWMSSIDEDGRYKKAISLLDEATKIDTDYLIAYWNKFGFQCHLKRYKDALVSGKQMLRLTPHDQTIKFLMGKIYDKLGDTVRARVYYKDYLLYCDRTLDTMSTSNKQRKGIEEYKAITLIMLGQRQRANDMADRHRLS